MYVVIVGCSAVGYHLAKGLIASGHEVVVVEKSDERYQLIAKELGSIMVHGDATDEGILKRAGVERADVMAAVTGRDETNLVVCQMTKHIFKVPRTMARIKDPGNEPIFHVLGVDLVVNATHLVLESFEEGVPGRPLLHLMNLPLPGMELVSVSIPVEAGVVGKRLDEVALPPQSFISLVVKKTGAQLPSNHMVLEPDDELVAVTPTGEEQTIYDILTGI
jgi:trk system potassium uptake protein TrkA